VRGKNTILKATVALFIGILAVSGMSVPRAIAQFTTVEIDPPSISGPIGYTFSVNVRVKDVDFLRAFEFTMSWDQRVLKVVPPPVEGWFLPLGGETYFVFSVGVAGESITVADLITDYGKMDGSGVLATINFEVIGGGFSDIMITGRLLDRDFNDIFVWDWFGAFFGSTYPFIDFKWFVPARNTSDPTDVDIVESGTMFYGDEIIFDASGSFDPDGTIESYEWTIREGGVDSFLGVNTKYTFTGPVVSWVPPFRSRVYNWFLGWADTTLNVTDNDGNVATYYTWIRIFRTVPARTIMENVGSRRHQLGRDGLSKLLWGQVQNRGGTGAYPPWLFALNVELGRIVHGYVWARMQFQIRDMSGAVVETLYSFNPQWVGLTLKTAPLNATWDLTGRSVGWYVVYGKGQYCGSGVAFGTPASGIAVKALMLKP